MQHYEKPSYREDCAKAGLCPSVLGTGPGNGGVKVYCDREQHTYLPDGSALHQGWFSPWTLQVTWTDRDALVVP